MKFSESLKKNYQFNDVYKKGRSFVNRHIVMYVLDNGTLRNRVGICVSKKVGNSVVRHHMTRIFREIYRKNEKNFKKGIDLVVICRKAALYDDFWGLEKSYMELAGRHEILDNT